ncbi:unnamed protein product [Heligmosomoides polygyrus]|uniref:Nudix_hydro domain-containing protein n=1 Tax=Heligmosomoides polygyrus TaxID=6339 RepID=A0A3P7YFJ5_HELPZ|nr:unnamed protein product [Heligmosomoides polygyrus]
MNKFGGILLESHLIPEEVLKSEFFGSELRQLILMWKRRNVQAIEFIVNPKDSHIISELIKSGFEFYLVAGSDLVLNRWIGEEPSRFPTEELRTLDGQEFFAPHLHVFIDYEKWIRAGIVSKTGDVDVNMFSYLFRR